MSPNATPAETAVNAVQENATASEPPAKKIKTGWENYAMNVSEALMKDLEGKHFKDLAKMEVSVLQGIGPFSTRVLEALHVETVEDLANYKYFHMARALTTLAETETKNGRLEGSVMNVDNAVDKEYESKSLKEICEAPTEAIQGLSAEASDLLATLGCKTIADLGTFKYCRWAESICELAKYENMLTEKERKVEAELKKLA